MQSIYNEYFLRKYLDDILKVYHYIDGIIVTDEKGYIQHYNSFRPDLNNIKPQEVQGKHILEAYPNLDASTSTIMRVLTNGEHIYDEFQEVTSYKGQKRYVIETTLPIKDDKKVVGAVNISRYVIQDRNMHDIILQSSAKGSIPTFESEATSICSINDIVTQSPQMQDIKAKILKIAGTGSNVLLVGETGTGKDIIAQSIHHHSPRSEHPYIYQNCAAIPATLLESILFGTVKGAYTGSEDKKGLFESAQNSTLFLDEINSMDLQLQPKILSAIEKKEFRRVGGTELLKTNVRVISAMNENPHTAIVKETLRRDLFYRLSSIIITVPPLRERKEDILLLANHFIRQYNRRFEKEIHSVSSGVESLFLHYDWPGNVRELKNIIEGAVALGEQMVITENELPDYLLGGRKPADDHPQPKPQGTLKAMMDAYEKQIILEELKKDRNLTRVAQGLGISRQALHYKIKKYQGVKNNLHK